jgi:hypothetical protein
VNQSNFTFANMQLQGHHHKLQDKSVGKQAEGTGTSEKDKQPAAQKKRTRTMSQALTTQPALLAPDAFAAALGAVPAEDWCRTWAAGRTIMLRRTSKRVKEVVDKMRLPAVVCLSRRFWNDGTATEKLQFVLRQLLALTAHCRIITLELQHCRMEGQDAERLVGVLAKCPALAHLDLSGNTNFGATGAGRLAGVLGQCRALAHLNLCGHRIDDAGAGSFAGVLGHCSALAHLDLQHNNIGPDGVESLAGVLGQCPALSHLDLGWNRIGPGGAESLAGVLGLCPALALLNLNGQRIGRAGRERLRASWRGQASGLLYDSSWSPEASCPACACSWTSD